MGGKFRLWFGAGGVFLKCYRLVARSIAGGAGGGVVATLRRRELDA